MPARSSGPSPSSNVRGIRRTSASQRCSGCPGPTSPDRSVATTASRRDEGPAITYMIASSVDRSAHWRSSITSTTGRSAHRRSSQASNANTNSPSCPVTSGSSPPATAIARNADRMGRNGIDIDANGRHVPHCTVDDASPSAQARATRAVLPTPGSPAIRIVCAAPPAERSRSPPMTASSSARPTTACASAPEASTAPVWHRCRRSGVPRRNSGGAPDSARARGIRPLTVLTDRPKEAS